MIKEEERILPPIACLAERARRFILLYRGGVGGDGGDVEVVDEAGF
jgi:hypothetical protein